MVYPRQCPLCAADCGQQAPGADNHHATARSEPGGTPSPWLPGLPGRLLTLVCQDCRGEYVWDYFAGRPVLETQDLPARQPRQGGRRVQQPVVLRGATPSQR
jgi:hypothetical protein